MAQLVKVEGKPVIPAGLYKAECLGTELVDGAKGQYRKWHFIVNGGGKYAGVELTGVSSTATSPSSKALEWYSILTGDTPKFGDTFDIDRVIGCKVNLNITVAQTEQGDFNRVKDLIPIESA